MKKGSYNERLVKRTAFCINYFQITYVLYVILLNSYITNWSVSKLKQLLAVTEEKILLLYATACFNLEVHCNIIILKRRWGIYLVGQWNFFLKKLNL